MTSNGTPYSYGDGVYTFPGDGCQLVLSHVRRNRHGGIDCDAELWTLDGSALLGTDRGDLTLNRFRGSLAGQTTKRNSGDTLAIENFILQAYIALKDDPNVVTVVPPPSFHPVAEFLLGVKPPGPQVVAGLLERGCLYAFASRPKVGKTIMLSNLAAAVSRGRDWLGRQVTPGRVYFFQLEDSDRTIKKRLERMLGPDSPPDLLLHVSPFRLCEENYDLTLSQVKGASLIICDPIIQATEVRDWNSQAEVREAYEFWRQLARDTDAAVCVSNHHRKMEGGYGDQMAGSIQALATVDGVIELYRDPKLQKSERKVSFVGRDWSDLPDEVVVLDVETLTWLFKGQLGEVIEQEKVDKREEDAQRVLAVLPGSPPGITLQEWEQQAGLNPKRLKAARSVLGSQVGSEGAGVKGSPLRFWRAVLE